MEKIVSETVTGTAKDSAKVVTGGTLALLVNSMWEVVQQQIRYHMAINNAGADDLVHQYNFEYLRNMVQAQGEGTALGDAVSKPAAAALI